jgi:dipeptidase
MCDTMVVLPPASASGAVLFGKNSDRERNEAQGLEMLPARDHEPGTMVQATNIAIPQVARTHAVLLSRPFWMWGAEMGANEHGVVIGNEAVHSRVPAPQLPALIGMDLLRLALERAASAAEAVRVIAELLERWGQGGNCGHLNPSFYHNAFLIADPAEAYVMETVGRMWAAERATPIRTISNAYSIRAGFTQASDTLAPHALAQGWCADPAALDLAAAYADPEAEPRSQGGARCARSADLLRRREGALGVRDVMAVLRDHGPDAEHDRTWHPQHAIARTICMHAADHERRGQTTGSLVSELRPNGAVHWVTGTAAPCTAIFKPVLFNAGGLPPHGPAPSDRFDADTLWWRHERLHRRLLSHSVAMHAEFRAERDALEASFVQRMAETPDAVTVRDCWAEAAATEARWLAALGTPEIGTRPAYAAAWRELNTLAMMPT